MGQLFYLMGKSASGKDTIYKGLMQMHDLDLRPVVMYTTRPPRLGESEGEQYHFVSEAKMHELEKEGKILEKRCYNTRKGKWYYFTVDDGSINLAGNNYLAIGTLESYLQIRILLHDKIIPIYIELDDGYRLLHATLREMEQDEPSYDELCRRYLSDMQDFSEENLREAGISGEYRFNNQDLAYCTYKIKSFIQGRI